MGGVSGREYVQEGSDFCDLRKGFSGSTQSPQTLDVKRKRDEELR
jgi:hypothetical protein